MSRISFSAVVVAVFLFVKSPTEAARPPLHTLVITTVSNVAAGSAVHITGDRLELGSLSVTGSIRMYNNGGNQWIGRVAVPGSVSSSVVSNKFTARTTSSGTHCTAGNGSISGATLTTNVPLWVPGYTGKTIFYQSRMTNVMILYKVGTNFVESPLMTRIGNGRTAGEHLYQITGIGEAGVPLEFVPHGYSNGVANVYDNSPYPGYGINNYFTPLDTFFLQDKNIFNYTPPTTVSAPQIVNTNWTSGYTANGILSRSGRIYLPRGYTQNTGKNYPVLYMHDGQNVFDPGGCCGSWGAEHAATREISQGRMRETIIVAVNLTDNRGTEYGPHQDNNRTGNYYLKFLVDNVKSKTDLSYRTLPDFMNTGNMGSSLGGLISAYVGLSSNVFGLVGALSPSYWYSPNFRTWIQTQNTKGNRIYQDCGNLEGASMWDYFWPVYTYYLQDDYVVNDDLLYVVGCGQDHNEGAWSARLPGAFQFLFNPWDEINGLETNTPSPGLLKFNSTSYSVSETGVNARVYVNRLDGSNGAASVNYTTSNGTALAGSEFTATSGALNWTNGDSADKFVDVIIADNGLYEGDKIFSVRLSGAAGATLGSPNVATVTITDDELPPPPPPELLVTNPVANIVVSNETASFNLQGLANPSNWLGLVWSNSLTGASGVAPISNAWTIGGIPLGVGTNVITISATNVGSAGVIASDSATNAAYNNDWTNGANGGSGWGTGWSLTAGNTSGRFVSDETSDLNNSAGPRAWGMYANNNQSSDAWRELSTNLSVGQVFALRFDNNWITNGGSVGFGLQNAAGTNLFEFFFVGGETNYTINASTENRNSDIDWSDTGWDIAFRLTNSSQYRFICGTNEITGALKSVADQQIVRFHTWNYNAGGGVDYNYYFNNLAVTGGVGGAGVSTSVTVTITRQAALYHDGIPMSWWDRYGLGTNSSAASNNDGDDANNWEEYVADTDPTSGSSVYSNRITSADGAETMTLQAGPPTTNSRLYDVWFGTNLIEGIWTPLNLDLPGANDGSAVYLTVTNDADSGLYRTGVKLP